MTKFSPDKDDRYRECDKIRNRPGKQNAVDAEEQRQDQDQRDQEKDLSCQRQQKSFQSFADRREEIGRQKLNTVDNGHEQEDAHE